MQLLNHLRNISGVVLQVTIDGNDYLALRMSKAGAEGGRLAKVPAETDNPYPAIGLVQFGQYTETAIGAAIVYENQLILVSAYSETSSVPKGRGGLTAKGLRKLVI
jgi:hypothetical protein